MADMIIRSAGPADLPGMLMLYRHLNPSDPVVEPAQAETPWADLIGCGLATVFVAEVGLVLASSCTLVIVPNLTRGVRPYGLIENVVTHEDYRQRGLGRAVLAAAVDAAWAANCYKVMLATASRLEATLRFYEAAGFARGGKTYFEVRRP
jgi:GNAT superfamily N-acetyltransferase